jgi:tRNA-Thr(GGU) m(6)t(6)A37 methyltransferase TsaA
VEVGSFIKDLVRQGRVRELVIELLRSGEVVEELAKYRLLDTFEEVRESFNGVDGYVEIFDEFAEGLEGIDDFSHIILISFLHKSKNRILRVKPRRLVRLGISEAELPEVGVFCTDSPRRPNPIGLSIVRLIKREGRLLRVSGLDLFNETPILDVKPYTHDRSIELSKLHFPNWYEKLRKAAGNRPI